MILAKSAVYSIRIQYQILKSRWSAVTYDLAGIPADSSLYPPNSGEGQGHSARSASSGTRGLWVSHAEQKLMKHLEGQTKTQTQALALSCSLCLCCKRVHACTPFLPPPALFETDVTSVFRVSTQPAYVHIIRQTNFTPWAPSPR